MENNPIMGAICGDIIGSIYEFDAVQGDLPAQLLTSESHYTDDTLLTLSVLNQYLGDRRYAFGYIKTAREEPLQAWGAGFRDWVDVGDPQNQNDSLGNGCVMRLSPIPFLVVRDGGDPFLLEDEAMDSCYGSHNHEVSMAAARAYSMAMYRILKGETLQAAQEELHAEGFHCGSLQELRETYRYSERVDHTLAESFQCCLEASSFDETMRNVISLKGDADTMCAVAGAFSAIVHGIPLNYLSHADTLLQQSITPTVVEGYAALRNLAAAA